MLCDICFRAGGNKLPFLCPIDARNQLYQPRLDHARMLLEKEKIDNEITAILDNRHAATAADTNHIFTNVQTTSKDLAHEKTLQIIARADELRTKIQEVKQDIARRKVAVARRKSELAFAKIGLEGRRSRLLEEADKKTKMTTFKWNQMHSTTAESRGFLGSEAAKLYGLKRLRDADGTPVNEYTIAGVPILDLRAMCNNARPAEITASFTHIAHLLILSTHYLQLRLPAEITLPHRDYPLPTIFHTKDSYKLLNIPFPGSTALNSSSNSPTASRHEEHLSYPRPRPLYINKPLPALAREDLLMFLEAASLLAYNVAWLCRVQGLPVGSSKSSSSSVDDVCELGANLYRALMDTSTGFGSSETTSPTSLRRTKEGRGSDPEDGAFPTPGRTLVGHFSHATAHTFLGGAVGMEFQKSFKLPSTTKVSEQLKAHVLSEVTGTGWTLVGDDDLMNGDYEEDPEEGDGVLVGGRRDRGTVGRAKERSNNAVLARVKGLSDFGAASFMTMQTVADDAPGGRKAGTKGWTLLKDRS